MELKKRFIEDETLQRREKKERFWRESSLSAYVISLWKHVII